MTLDDAITYYDEMAETCRRNARIESNDYMDMRDSASEAEQIASWLNELKLLRERIETQPEPEIYWGYTPTYERPLADVEIVSRLRDIQKQIPGGSYAIDRAIEIIEAVAERRTDD